MKTKLLRVSENTIKELEKQAKEYCYIDITIEYRIPLPNGEVEYCFETEGMDLGWYWRQYRTEDLELSNRLTFEALIIYLTQELQQFEGEVITVEEKEEKTLLYTEFNDYDTRINVILSNNPISRDDWGELME